MATGPPAPIGLRLSRIAAIALVLLAWAIDRSWAANSDGEICDLTADSALGLEDYPAAIVLHREFLRSHRDDALAHYHLGFAYGMTGRTTYEINEYLTAARLGLHKWDLFLNLGLAYLGQNDSAGRSMRSRLPCYWDQLTLKRISIWRLHMKKVVGCPRLCWRLPLLCIWHRKILMKGIRKR